ncbi:FtsK/SpoIIIE domain-containing protein [Streptomyces polygonati]|uniref:FtsK/SpoIIIE domain-containing protein n=1 Tax=Streptomyces polygonati TaxID=1617087 RepID=A0ABV8HIJ8_9ACTN
MNVSVRDPQDEGVSTAVVVDTEPSARAGRFAAELARAVGHPGSGPDRAPEPALFVGAEAVDPLATLRAAGIRDGMDLGLGAPVPTEPEPEGRTEIRVVSGAGAGTVYRLMPGDYDIGGAPACRIRLAPGAPPVAARVRVAVDGSAELLGAEMALMDGKAARSGAGWREGSQLAVGDILLELTSRQSAKAPLTAAQDGLGLEFNRPPRFLPPSAGARFRLPTPPVKPDKRPIPLLPILLLPAGSAAIAIFVTKTWTFVFIALLSPVAALVTQFGGRKQAMVKYLEQKAEHEKVLARLHADIDAAILEEQHNLRLALPDPASLLQMATQPSERLWERRWQDPDFLSVRVGTADLPSSLSVEDPTQDEHRRTTVPRLNQVPVSVAMRRAGVAGIAGPGAARLAGWMAAQAASLHSPADLRIVVLAGPEGEKDWSWTRWLPHAQAQGEDAYSLVGSTTDSLARRIGELGQLVQSRIAAGPELVRGGVSGYPDVLVVLEQARRARSLPGVIALLRDGPSVGVHTICIDREERLLPEECGAVVVIETGAPGSCRVRTGSAAALPDVRTDSPEPGWYEALARSLAPLRGVGDSDESALPGSVRLLDLLGLEPPSAKAVVAGWSLGGRSTRAILGTGYDGDFSVDLVRDGPHALIAGTTGSGKSELLQTLVATLAVVNRPDEMTFVLVDYKGGSAFAECADLPHTVGLVTDLDTHLVERALVSLGAELRRRETQLAEVGAKDVVDYLDKRQRGGNVMPPLPRLLLVIDEFASMVRELPDFIAGLVNIAQRGRSLGIHLVLATQRPGGAVTPDIRANTNLRIALRTTDTTESRDIIDAPDSGDISPANPGRAYARLGPSALLPFQAGRVGGRRPGGQSAAETEVPVRAAAVAWRDLGGPLIGGPARASGPAGTEAVTDLAVLTAAVARAARLAEVPRQPSPWLPALPDLLEWTVPAAPLPAERRPGALPAVAYGLVDLPARQARAPLTFDLDRAGHLHIVGSPRSGRSQTLRTLAAALAQAHGADDVHLYGIDCGNGALNALTALPHCGAVVDRNQVERLGRLLDRLNTELTTRQGVLGARGTADLTELRTTQPPERRLPHIVLMVDRFEVFEREFTAYDNGSLMERLVRLLRDGAGAGIHVVLAGDRVLGSSRFSGTTEDKIVLRLNDRQDYSSVGIPTRSAPAAQAPGRGIRTQDLTETQIAVLGADLAGTAQARVLIDLGKVLAEREAGITATRRPLSLDVLPDRISYAEAAALHGPTGMMRPMVAIGGDVLASLGPDLADVPTFVVAGPPRTGRSTVLLTAALSLLARGTGVIVLAPRRSPLRELAGRPGISAVITDAEVPVADFRKVLGNVSEANAVILVDDAELFMGSEIESDLALLARGGAGNGWGLMAAGNAESLSLSLGGWMGQVKRNRTGMLLSPQTLSDGDVIGVRLSRGLVGQAPQPGRGLLHLGDGALVAVQVPLSSVDG